MGGENLKLNFIHHEKSKPSFVCKTVDIAAPKKRKLTTEVKTETHSPLVQSIRSKVVFNRDDIEEEIPSPPPPKAQKKQKKQKRKKRHKSKPPALPSEPILPEPPTSTVSDRHFLTPVDSDIEMDSFNDSPCVVLFRDESSNEPADPVEPLVDKSIQTSPASATETPPKRRNLIRELTLVNKEKDKAILKLQEINKFQRETIRKLNKYLTTSFPNKFV